MKTPLTLITGASRGLGLAMAQQCLQAGHSVLTLQRQPSRDLEAMALALAAPLEQWAVDLADPVPVAQRLHDWLVAAAAQGRAHWTELRLIHNAALLTAPGPLRDTAFLDISRALRASLEAPVVLTAAFLAATRGWSAPRKVLNISSGLGRRAMAGSAVYCASKAGLDHLSRALALEEGLVTGGARVVSLAPGVIDTDMQQQLRGADPAVFAEQGVFEQLHRQGQLASPQQAAQQVLARLDRPDFGQQPVADVRDA